MSTFTFTPEMTTEDAAAAYQAADAKGKAAMRSGIQAAIASAVSAADIELAQHYLAVQSVLVVTKVTPDVDWVAVVRQRRADLVAALAAIRSGQFDLPDGATIPDDADLTGGTPDDDAVAALLVFKGTRKASGSVKDYLAAHVTGTPQSIAELRRAWTTADASHGYPEAPPSSGAIGAAFSRGVDGCSVVQRNGVACLVRDKA